MIKQIQINIKELKKNGVISEAIFALYLAETDTQSLMHIGGYDQTIVDTAYEANEWSHLFGYEYEGIYWLEIDSVVHWQAKIFNFEVNE